ncbi:MAG TPA: hypothetical protein VM283_04810 [Armatimonadota bacterium]|nr:hypothetical protein [Armatimonadota bacterium]
MSTAWLQPGDRLILDGADHRVTECAVGRTDRLSFQRVRVRPELGGDERLLLQIEEAAPLEAEPIEAAKLEGQQVTVGEEGFALSWEGQVRTERAAAEGRGSFGRGRCSWYESGSGGVAVRVDARPEGWAVVAHPLPPSRIDLRFTNR